MPGQEISYKNILPIPGARYFAVMRVAELATHCQA